MDAILSHSIAGPRLNAVLLSTFSGFAMVLTAVGIYGVVSYSVAQSTREIGIRVALGASPGRVLRRVLRQGLVLALIGIAVGMAGAVFATRTLESLLFGLTALDAASFAGMTFLVFVIAALATLIPALRAVRVSPITALRQE
jgi:putative ABC transport system permease protein